VTSRQWAEAAKAWEQIAAIRPVDSMPHLRLAGLYHKLNEGAKEIEQLRILAKVELKDNRYARMIARLYSDEGKWAEAAQYALDAVYINPYDVTAHELFKTVCEKTNNAAGAQREARVIEELARLQQEQEKQEQSDAKVQ